MLEVLHVCVGPREDLGYVAVIPLHPIWGAAVLAQHLEDLAIAIRLPLMVAANDEAVTGRA